MADYQIACANLLQAHRHIVAVGVAGRVFTVQQVYSLMDAGNTFHTGTGSTRATVAKYKCDMCGAGTLRSHADGRWNNNLDNLGPC